MLFEAVLPVGQEVALNFDLFILGKPRLKPRIWDSLLDLNCQRSIEERAHLHKEMCQTILAFRKAKSILFLSLVHKVEILVQFDVGCNAKETLIKSRRLALLLLES